MKVLENNNGLFGLIETPDIRVHKIHELEDCTIPPLYILYENQIYVFEFTYNNTWQYKTVYNYIPSNAAKEAIDNYPYLIYNTLNKTVTTNGTIASYEKTFNRFTNGK